MSILTRLKAQVIMLAVATLATLSISRCEAGTLTMSITPELTQGEVRVRLLRVGPMVSTNGEPAFGVIYSIELPKEGAFSDLKRNGPEEIALFVGGEAIDLPSATSSSSSGTKPVVTEGRARLTAEILFPKLKIDSKEMDVQVAFTWRGKEYKFEFKNVSVKSATIAI